MPGEVTLGAARGPGHAKTFWWLVSALAIVLSALGIATSNGWSAGEHQTLTPPYEVPPIADALFDDDTIAASVGVPMLLLTEGAPENRSFLSQSAFVADVRGALIGLFGHSVGVMG